MQPALDKQQDVISASHSRASKAALAPNEHAATTMFELAPNTSTGVKRSRSDRWLYVVAGSGVVRQNGAPVSLKRGTLVVIRRKERHEIVNEGAESLRAISTNTACEHNAPSRRWLAGTTAAALAGSAGMLSWVVSIFVR